MKNNVQDILDMIRKRRNPNKHTEWYEQEPIDEILEVVNDEDWNFHENIAPAPVPADDYQEFKRKFCESVGNEPVFESGLTHSEFLNYIKTAGWRDGDEFEYERTQVQRDLKRYRSEWTGEPVFTSEKLRKILDSLEDE